MKRLRDEIQPGRLRAAIVGDPRIRQETKDGLIDIIDRHKAGKISGPEMRREIRELDLEAYCGRERPRFSAFPLNARQFTDRLHRRAAKGKRLEDSEGEEAKALYIGRRAYESWLHDVKAEIGEGLGLLLDFPDSEALKRVVDELVRSYEEAVGRGEVPAMPEVTSLLDGARALLQKHGEPRVTWQTVEAQREWREEDLF